MIDETTLQDTQAEKTLIGAVGHHPDALAHVLARVPGDAFYDPNRGTVWDVLRGLSDDRQPITPTTVGRRLAADGQWDACRRVVTTEFTDAHSVLAAEQRHGLVLDLAARRELARAVKHAAQLVAQSPDDTPEVLARVRAVFDDLGPADAETGGTLTWPQLCDEFETAHAPGASPQGLTTPWYELDDLIGGLYGGRMYTVGGSAGSGKSALAINIAEHSAAAGASVLIFSKEMPTLDVTGRIVARGTQTDLRAINNRRLDDLDRQRFREFRNRTAGYNLRVNADAVSMRQVAQIARATQHRVGLDVLVVDYLQLMTGDDRARTAEEEIAKISTQLKQLAMALDVAVVVPAQLNRAPAGRADGRPTKADLRSSGRIEQDSDVVILLWRAPLENGQPDAHNLTLIVDKNRHGPTGDVRLRWRGTYGAVG